MEQYSQRFKEFKKKEDISRFKFNTLSNFRLIYFLLSMLIIIYFIEESKDFARYYFYSFIIIFSILMYYHERLLNNYTFFKSMKEINEIELKKLKGDLSSLDTGEEFIDNLHPYTSDLDIFGKGSIFQYLNRCNSFTGINLFSRWLKNSAAKEEILKRQESIKELSENLNWRQELQAHGLMNKDEERNSSRLIEWVKIPPSLLNRQYLRIIAKIYPFISLYTLYLSWSSWKLRYFLPVLLFGIFIIAITEGRISKIYSRTRNSSRFLISYINVLKHIESSNFKSEKLVILRNNLKFENNFSSFYIRKLQKMVSWLDLRRSIIHFVFNFLFLWDLNFCLALELWKKRAGLELENWLTTIGEFECLSSLAILKFENSNYCFPEIDDEYFNFEAVNMGHVLIPDSSRINNSIRINKKGKIIIITGSNMAGKSTFLRTVGTTIVLGLMGSPVCADQCRMSSVLVYTAMSSKDSLEKGVSSFYAELDRIRSIIHKVDNNNNVFVMLDEMLKGTNSEDRHTGSVSLIKQLLREEISGIIATHDLDLGKLERELPDNIENLCFNGIVEENELSFDYKLHPGICQCMNAIALMKNMGIKIEKIDKTV